MYFIILGMLLGWITWLLGRRDYEGRQKQDSCCHAHKSCDDCGQKGL